MKCHREASLASIGSTLEERSKSSPSCQLCLWSRGAKPFLPGLVLGSRPWWTCSNVCLC
jgi:hypothetical protein